MSFLVNIYKSFMSKSSVFTFKTFQIKEVKAKDGSVPKARSGHRMVSDEVGNIYSFGGYNPNLDDDADLRNDHEWQLTKPLFKELWKFNVSSKKWTKLKTTGQAPGQLASHCATLINRYLVVFGGTGVPFGQNSSNQMYICNMDTLQWQLVAVDPDDDQVPAERYGQAMVYDQRHNCIYVIGGTNGFNYSLDVHRFDLDSMSWKVLYKKSPFEYESWPLERYRHEIAIYDEKLFIIGGGTANTCFDIKSIPVFNTETFVWSLALTTADNDSSFPEQRRCHGLIQIEHNVYIAGGTNGTSVCDDIWNLNLKTLQWQKIVQRMPRPVCFHAMSVSPFGEMTIFGGVTDPNHKHRTNELYSIWLNVPPLKELAWLAVAYYINKNKLYKNCLENAQNIGIPNNYINRLDLDD